jgi:hypothetical protein
MVIRGQEAIFRSEEQQHSFNFPFQLGTGSRDLPKDAQVFAVKVKEGDIIIVGSDGLFDNVFDDEILDIVSGVVDKPSTGGDLSLRSQPKDITDALLRKAREVAEDSRTTSSPFQSRAIQEGLYYQGGKLDDCTVLAAIVG